MLSVIMLNVVMLNVVMLSIIVVAPQVLNVAGNTLNRKELFIYLPWFHNDIIVIAMTISDILTRYAIYSFQKDFEIAIANNGSIVWTQDR